MDLQRQWQINIARQLAVDEGLSLMRQARADLSLAAGSAAGWAFVAIASSAVLVPANCIINAFDLKAANGLYQALVRELFSRTAASGTRQSGSSLKLLLATTKKVLVEELKRKGLTQYVPGVNILIGLAEDTTALLEAAQMVESGTRELRLLSLSVDRQIAAAERQLIALGIDRARMIDRLGVGLRTS